MVPQETPECGSRAPLMECMKILNILAKDLHEEAKCIRSEISEIHDSFGAESNGQSEARHQLIELSKYVRILEYRLKQVPFIHFVNYYEKMFRRIIVKIVKLKMTKTVV